MPKRQAYVELQTAGCRIFLARHGRRREGAFRLRADLVKAPVVPSHPDTPNFVPSRRPMMMPSLRRFMPPRVAPAHRCAPDAVRRAAPLLGNHDRAASESLELELADAAFAILKRTLFGLLLRRRADRRTADRIGDVSSPDGRCESGMTGRGDVIVVGLLTIAFLTWVKKTPRSVCLRSSRPAIPPWPACPQAPRTSMRARAQLSAVSCLCPLNAYCGLAAIYTCGQREWLIFTSLGEWGRPAVHEEKCRSAVSFTSAFRAATGGIRPLPRPTISCCVA
jgi:hypothetical protein